MNPRRQRRLALVSIILVAVAVSTALVLFALSKNIDLFYTPTELVEGKGETQQRPAIGQRLRIGGLVVPNSVRRDEDGLTVLFDLVDVGDATVTVEYTGILQDLFREGQGIVAQGTLVDERRVAATEVLAKHDEEYMPPELAKMMKNIEHVPPRLQDPAADSNSEGSYDR